MPADWTPREWVVVLYYLSLGYEWKTVGELLGTLPNTHSRGESAIKRRVYDFKPPTQSNFKVEPQGKGGPVKWDRNILNLYLQHYVQKHYHDCGDLPAAQLKLQELIKLKEDGMSILWEAEKRRLQTHAANPAGESRSRRALGKRAERPSPSPQAPASTRQRSHRPESRPHAADTDKEPRSDRARGKQVERPRPLSPSPPVARRRSTPSRSVSPSGSYAWTLSEKAGLLFYISRELRPWHITVMLEQACHSPYGRPEKEQNHYLKVLDPEYEIFDPNRSRDVNIEAADKALGRIFGSGIQLRDFLDAIKFDDKAKAYLIREKYDEAQLIDPRVDFPTPGASGTLRVTPTRTGLSPSPRARHTDRIAPQPSLPSRNWSREEDAGLLYYCSRGMTLKTVAHFLHQVFNGADENISPRTAEELLTKLLRLDRNEIYNPISGDWDLNKTDEEVFKILENNAAWKTFLQKVKLSEAGLKHLRNVRESDYVEYAIDMATSRPGPEYRAFATYVTQADFDLFDTETWRGGESSSVLSDEHAMTSAFGNIHVTATHGPPGLTSMAPGSSIAGTYVVGEKYTGPNKPETTYHKWRPRVEDDYIRPDFDPDFNTKSKTFTAGDDWDILMMVSYQVPIEGDNSVTSFFRDQGFDSGMTGRWQRIRNIKEYGWAEKIANKKIREDLNKREQRTLERKEVRRAGRK